MGIRYSEELSHRILVICRGVLEHLDDLIYGASDVGQVLFLYSEALTGFVLLK